MQSFQYTTANVIGEAEWKSEANRCEGIVIDSFLSSSDSAVPNSDVTSDIEGDTPVYDMLYDGVIADFESTHHGRLSSHLEPLESPVSNIVHPDTILRQMILHEIHSDGMGPDWEFQDSLELLLGRCSIDTSDVYYHML